MKEAVHQIQRIAKEVKVQMMKVKETVMKMKMMMMMRRRRMVRTVTIKRWTANLHVTRNKMMEKAR